MNNFTRITATALLTMVSVAAFAQSSSDTAARDRANMTARDNYPVVAFHSTKTRAEVTAELVKAQQAGLITNGDNYPVVAFHSTKTRAEVTAELVKAQQAGLIANGDNYPVLPQQATVKSSYAGKADAVAFGQGTDASLYSGA